jgi:hypothetical protein
MWKRESRVLFAKNLYLVPITHYSLKLHCPEHNTVLEPALWTNLVETKSPRNPRLVYDLNGNILLVQRFYFCRYGKHRYLSSSPEILRIIPDLYSAECFPIKVLYRSAFSKQAVDYVTSQVSQGVNFLQISEAIATLHFKDYCRRGNRYITCLLHENSHPLQHDFKAEDFFNDALFVYPSNDLLMRIFLEDFQDKKVFYENELKKTTATVSLYYKYHSLTSASVTSQASNNQIYKYCQPTQFYS